HTSVVPAAVNGSGAATSREDVAGLSQRPAGTSTAVKLPSGSAAVAWPVRPVVAATSRMPATVKGNGPMIGTTITLSPAATCAMPLVGGTGAAPAKVSSVVCWVPT